MKRLLVVFLFFVALGGCAGPNKAFVGGVDALWKVIGPEYRAYVAGDAALSEEEKTIHLQSATSMDKLISEAQK